MIKSDKKQSKRLTLMSRAKRFPSNSNNIAHVAKVFHIDAKKVDVLMRNLNTRTKRIQGLNEELRELLEHFTND
ncbi:unnamed protein product [Thelazia callipaeda]|uniref:Transposase n=1 Tax=Thelazia callipaeda TaxID=103827 RepID=A0A0N5D621_THECL|nr:unnamed protein product [Thelazia callipaeda]